MTNFHYLLRRESVWWGPSGTDVPTTTGHFLRFGFFSTSVFG